VVADQFENPASEHGTTTRFTIANAIYVTTGAAASEGRGTTPSITSTRPNRYRIGRICSARAMPARQARPNARWRLTRCQTEGIDSSPMLDGGSLTSK